MARPTGAPPFEAAYVGVLDVSDADTDWHTVASDDFFDFNSGTVTTKLPAGLVLVGIVVDAVDDDGATAFRYRVGDVENGSGAAATGAHSAKVNPGGADSNNFRGIASAPTALSYKQGTASKSIQIRTYWDAA